ncbi:ComEC/Rec2 family competence protein [Corynebacterium qintianiae]|uniref:ComEC/Rec2 family competence protein n=1 Tax=Corynebacterium qintianiae TaxID=2709392 RepID=UPI001F39501F|nr:ComEC/Rec2 family competence protein [Corynebacterium qintianiae]
MTPKLQTISGSNVAIVTVAATVFASAVGLGLRGRIAVAAAALTVFATLVGPEPSVLRASVTGLVGLTAVLSSSVAEPVHALCLAVIGLVLVNSNLAVNYGFALSVAATAGIVALSPVLRRAFAPTGWPDILVRALAVAIAADVVTMPIVALMAGQVSLVSVVANVLVAPAAAPVTVLGLFAVILALLPGGLEKPVLWVIEPMTEWIHTVAAVGAGLPVSTVGGSPLVVVVCYGWVLAGFLLGRPRVTIAAVVTVVTVVAAGGSGARWQTPIDTSRLNAHVVARESEVEPVPAHSQVVVVMEEGAAHDRPVITQGGIPVLYPRRDGRVTLYPDGTQRAASGRF